MLRIRYSSREVDVEGTVRELRHLRNQVLELAFRARGRVTIAADADFDPAPYDRVLQVAVISIGTGPTMVEVVDGDQLFISATPDNLRRLASFIDVPGDAKEGWHSHYEYFEGNKYIMSSSTPVVFSLERSGR